MLISAIKTYIKKIIALTLSNKDSWSGNLGECFVDDLLNNCTSTEFFCPPPPGAPVPTGTLYLLREWLYPKSASIRALGNSSAVAPGTVTHSYTAEGGRRATAVSKNPANS